MKINEYILKLISILLLTLWIFTAAIKFGNMTYNVGTMRKQIFPVYFADMLAYVIPILALVCAGLLLYKMQWGLWASVVLLSSFSLYIIIFLTEIITPQTCSCAGIFSGMDYTGHLLFNCIMLCIASMGLFLYYKHLHGDAENREQSRHYTTIYKHHD